jgi:predicted metal-binding protein
VTRMFEQKFIVNSLIKIILLIAPSFFFSKIFRTGKCYLCNICILESRDEVYSRGKSR